MRVRLTIKPSAIEKMYGRSFLLCDELYRFTISAWFIVSLVTARKYYYSL